MFKGVRFQQCRSCRKLFKIHSNDLKRTFTTITTPPLKRSAWFDSTLIAVDSHQKKVVFLNIHKPNFSPSVHLPRPGLKNQTWLSLAMTLTTRSCNLALGLGALKRCNPGGFDGSTHRSSWGFLDRGWDPHWKLVWGLESQTWAGWTPEISQTIDMLTFLFIVWYLIDLNQEEMSWWLGVLNVFDIFCPWLLLNISWKRCAAQHAGACSTRFLRWVRAERCHSVGISMGSSSP